MGRWRLVTVGALTAALAFTYALPVARADDGPPDPIGIGPLPLPPLPPIPGLPPLPFFPPPPGPPPPPPPSGCSTAARPFVPDTVDLTGIADDVQVVAVGRDSQNRPGAPPISHAGKYMMAFDLGSGVKPGDPHGNSLFNAHTWPDGSALGNEMLDRLHSGDHIVVHGSGGRICYRVTDRVEVPAEAVSNGRSRYFETAGPPQIAIAVCSGRRIGPGHWTKRTLWFAAPVR
ncbi:MAG TPA: class F sortase [Sporichthyaceae bacterium]|jgi:hypothetical protein|nr:class F sortase [Sporichthyaceae bacterium]